MNWGRKYFRNLLITEKPEALPLPNWETGQYSIIPLL
jgi:hypothetical protein